MRLIYTSLFKVNIFIFPQTVRFKNELERNITIKLGYANAKVTHNTVKSECIVFQYQNQIGRAHV